MEVPESTPALLHETGPELDKMNPGLHVGVHETPLSKIAVHVPREPFAGVTTAHCASTEQVALEKPGYAACSVAPHLEYSASFWQLSSPVDSKALTTAVTLFTFQLAKLRLNADAELNVLLMLVTLAVFQLEMSPLNAEACWNI